ncbi:DUF6049 family protein [Ruania halotolerans]|uniref:DUF6049 family protein n=1 Tax=Ruania halotolerans TaxID=2897773 RepID=UPI001E62012D|nr:DUF6049 family protein [Ruania halotolerans]UFU06524.1 DUF6049 family protein [Ruania halotolerans]
MIAPPAEEPRDHRWRRTHQGRTRARLGLGLLLALMGVLGGTALPFAPASPATAEVTEGEVSVDITQITPAVTRPGDDIVIRGTLGNGTAETIEAPQMQLLLQRHVPASRIALESWLSGENTLNAAILTVEYLDDVPSGAEVPFTITLPAERSPFDGALWGPRGIEVRAVSEGLLAAERTALLWYPGEAQVSAPTELSVLVPFTPTTQEWETSVATDSPVAQVAADRLGPVLAGMPDGVAWAIDAALLEGQAVESGGEETAEPEDAGPEETADTTDTASPAAEETAEGTPSDDDTDTDTDTGSGDGADPTLTEQFVSGAAQRDVIALGYADADQSVLTGPAGATLIRAGQERTAELFAAHGISALDDVAWPESADLTSVTALAEADARAVVLPADAMPTTVPLNYTPSGRTQVETSAKDVEAMLWDGQLSDSFSADLSALQIRQSVLAQTAVIAREQPADARGLLAALDREVGSDPDELTALSDTITALDDAPWVQLSNLRSLLGRTAAGEARAPLPVSTASDAHLDAGTLSRLAEAWSEADAFAQVTDDPTQFRDEFAPPVLTGLSSTLITAPTTRDQLVEDAFAAVAELSSGISVEPGSEVLLISSSGEIPITLESNLPVGASVAVQLVPADPRLLAEESVTTHLPPGGATTVRLPVTAVANGNVNVSVEVLNTEGNVLVAPEPFRVRVRADWEDIGTVVVAGLLVLGLAVGLIRTIRKGHRRFEPVTRASAAQDSGPDGEASPRQTSPAGELAGRSPAGDEGTFSSDRDTAPSAGTHSPTADDGRP